MKELLYKKDIKGNILQWNVDVEFINDGLSVILTTYGVINGGLVTQKREITTGKNIGKSNETTVNQQAIKEAQHDFEDKLKSGYKTLEMLDINIDDIHTVEDLHQLLDERISIDDTTAEGNLLPMKCKVFVENKMSYPCGAQPKINGCRAFVGGRKAQNLDLFTDKEYEIVLFAKRGDEFDLPTLQSTLESIIVHDETYTHTPEMSLAKYLAITGIVIDGECYVHGYPAPSISGACRNPKNPLNSRMGYISFDLAIDKVTQIDRIYKLSKLGIPLLHISQLQYFERAVVTLETENCLNDIHSKALMEEYIRLGAEGVVLRDFRALYRFGKRPATIMKRKETKDAEFTIVAIHKNEGNDGAKFTCINDITDDTFEVSCIGSMTKQRRYYESKVNYIGKLAKVKFYERTKNGLPFNATLMYVIE